MKYLSFLICFILISSCSKKEDLTLRIKGKVIDEITGKPIPFFPIVLVGKSLIRMEENLVYSKTDENGNYNFTYERNGENYDDFSSHYIECDRKDSVDTNAVEWKYFFSSWVQSHDNHKVMAKNAGDLTVIHENHDKWNELNLEWLVIKTTNFQDTITSKSYGVYFYEMPSKSHTIQWYYKSNGVVSKIYKDEIYVPNKYGKKGNIFYRIHID